MNYVINWDGFKLKTSAVSLSEVWDYILPLVNEEEYPQSITLHDGRIMPYNDYLFHNCFAKGRISEEQLINFSLANEKGGQS